MESDIKTIRRGYYFCCSCILKVYMQWDVNIYENSAMGNLGKMHTIKINSSSRKNKYVIKVIESVTKELKKGGIWVY